MIEKFTGIFKGPKSVSVGSFEIEDGQLFRIEKSKINPFQKPKRILVAGNIADRLRMCDKRKIFNLETGEKTGNIRFYPFSLEDYEIDFTQVDQDILYELDSKRTECDHYSRIIASLMELVEKKGIKDYVMSELSEQMGFINKMKTSFVKVEKGNPKK